MTNWNSRIKAAFAVAMGKPAGGAPRGVQVLSRGTFNFFVTEHDDSHGKKVLQFAHSVGQSAVVLSLDGKDSSVIFLQRAFVECPASVAIDGAHTSRDKLLYKPGSETLAQELYDQIKASIVGGGSRHERRWIYSFVNAVVLLLAGAGVILLLSAALGGKPAAKASASIPGPIGSQALAAPAALPPVTERIPAEARATEQERAAVEALQGVVKLGASGKPFYVFTDPNCPFCKQFEKTIENAPRGYQPIVIPLGYKEGSRATVVGVLCSDDPVVEWRKAMAQGPSASLKACDRGERLVQENMALFEALRLNRTPTVLTPGNMLVSGAASPEELVLVLGGLQK